MLLMVIKFFFVLMNSVIGIYDFSFYRIPNSLLGGLLILYGIYAAFYLNVETILSSAGVGLVMLILGFGLFAFKFIGAGDAKYLAVASLWVGAAKIVNFILIFSLIGGVLSVIYLLLTDFVARFSDWVWSQIQKAEARCSYLEYVWVGSGKGPEKKERANISSRVIPYGIAIALGSITIMLYNNSLNAR